MYDYETFLQTLNNPSHEKSYCHTLDKWTSYYDKIKNDVIAYNEYYKITYQLHFHLGPYFRIDIPMHEYIYVMFQYQLVSEFSKRLQCSYRPYQILKHKTNFFIGV
jgi:hypothetical protein